MPVLLVVLFSLVETAFDQKEQNTINWKKLFYIHACEVWINTFLHEPVQPLNPSMLTLGILYLKQAWNPGFGLSEAKFEYENI